MPRIFDRVSGTPSPKVSRVLVAVLNALATVQIVWFYLSWVAPYIKERPYELGVERMPYQGRLLMMAPMRWAHDSTLLNGIASRLTAHSMYFDFGVRPEGILQAFVDIACVVVTGMVARAIYRKASRTQVLLPFIYPLTLVMVLVTYCTQTMHHLRMIYDFPSLALFSIGLYLIYFRRNILVFGLLFLIATVNRETSVFLLLFYVVGAYSEERSIRGLLKPGVLAVLALLSAFWIGWHHWVGVRFANLPTEAAVRWKLNLLFLLKPMTWPQVYSVAAFTLPVVLLYGYALRDRVLKDWLWVVAVWAVFMCAFGELIEVRVFGELIPYMACCAALVAEEVIVARLRRGPSAMQVEETPA